MAQYDLDQDSGAFLDDVDDMKIISAEEIPTSADDEV